MCVSCGSGASDVLEPTPNQCSTTSKRLKRQTRAGSVKTKGGSGCGFLQTDKHLDGLSPCISAFLISHWCLSAVTDKHLNIRL